MQYKVNNKLIADYSGTGWEELLYILDAGYIDLPKKGTPEYNNLLVEWVVMKNNNTSESLFIADDFKLYENLWN